MEETGEPNLKMELQQQKKKKTRKAMAMAVVSPRMHTHRYPTRYCLRTAASLSPPHSQSQSQLLDLPMRGAEQNTVVGQVLAACRFKDQVVIVACGKRRKIQVQIPGLPHDVIFKILLLLPAKLLYEAMRYVCWEWYNIVNDPLFITAHHQMSSKGILFQRLSNRLSAYYVERNSAGSDLEVTEFRIPFRSFIQGNSNGFVLLYDYVNHPRILHLANLVTGFKMSLPPLLWGRKPIGFEFALSCTSSGRFKVVCVTRESDTSNEVLVIILTVGVDTTWRLFNNHDDGILMSQTQVVWLLSRARSVVAGGFIYWIRIERMFGVAMDVDAETMYQFTLPDTGFQFGVDDVAFLKPSIMKNKEMSFGLSIYFSERRRWELWNLVDVKSCKWVNFMVIDEATIFDNKLGKTFTPIIGSWFLQPFCLENGHIWMRVQDTVGVHVVCYNLETGNFLSCPYDLVRYAGIPWFHFNSLLSLNI